MKPGDVRRIRLELGLSRSALSRAVGAAQPAVGRWEAGIYAPSRANARLLELLLAAHRAQFPLGNGKRRRGKVMAKPGEGQGEAAQ